MRAEVAQRIRELYESNGRVITPDIVIHDAKDEASPLHNEFEWDVNKAALDSWRETARRLIRGVRVKIETTEIQLTRKPIAPIEFTELPGKARGDQGYVRLADLRGRRELALAAMQREIGRIESAVNRAKEIAEELDLTDEVELTASALVELKRKVNEAA